MLKIFPIFGSNPKYILTIKLSFKRTFLILEKRIGNFDRWEEVFTINTPKINKYGQK